MSTLRRQVVANYAGQGWAALMGFAFLPLYIHQLGLEAFGLIGFFTVAQAWLVLFDFGLTPTLTRELARRATGERSAEFICDLVRSLEMLYAAIGIALFAVLWLAAVPIGHAWLQLGSLDPEQAYAALRMMAFVLAARWVEQVYRGALQGLQEQVWLNTTHALLASARWGGSFVVLEVGSGTLFSFFAWQAIVSVVTVALLTLRTHTKLPRISRSPRYDNQVLRQVGHFAGGVFLATFLGVLLTQGDKLILSRLLSLDQFGAYMLASSATAALTQLIVPMNAAVFPHFSSLTRPADREALVGVYRSSYEWLSALVIPPALVLAFFPAEVMTAWTGDSALAVSVAPLLRVLALGTLCNGFMNVPYMLQLANGWTSLVLCINIVAVAIFFPALFWLIGRYGALGAAYAWLSLNAAYVLVTAHLMHRRLLPGEKGRWYSHAIGRPLLAGAGVAGVLRFTVSAPGPRLESLALVALALLAVAVSVLATMPQVRESIQRRLSSTPIT